MSTQLFPSQEQLRDMWSFRGLDTDLLAHVLEVGEEMRGKKGL